MVPARLLKSLKRLYWAVRFELYAIVCFTVGTLKATYLFRADRDNKLEIGVGSSGRKAGFITSDIFLGSDFPCDLRLGLPFPDESLDFIYAEHVFEHFQYNEVLRLIQDCRRCLKIGGRLNVSVPDASHYLRGYFNPQRFDAAAFCLYDAGLKYHSPIDYVNYIAYMGGHHRHLFDGESLKEVLSEVFPQNVRLRDFDATLDKVERRYESIYAECFK